MSTSAVHELGELMGSAIARVQREVDHKAVAVIKGVNPELDRGIEELDTFHEALGAGRAIRNASQICLASQDPELGAQFQRPGILLIDHPLQVIGGSPDLPMEDRKELVQKWIIAASSGPGRYYPIRLAARLSAPFVLKTVSTRAFSLGTDWGERTITAAGEIVDYLDTSIPIVGPFLSRVLRFEREQSYRNN